MTADIEKLKALAPASPEIKPWRERYEEAGHAEGGEFYMQAEIDELRADNERLRAEKEAPDLHVIPPPRGTGSQQDAGASILDALRNGIPLREPVNITKAVLARREARVSLSGGTGPVACAMLVNIQLTGWAEGPEKAEAFASGYNTAMKWYRDALLDLAERVSADAATRCRVEGGNTSENMVVDKAAKNDAENAETRMDSGFDGAGKISAPAAGTDKDAERYRWLRDGSWTNHTHPEIREHLMTCVNRMALDATIDAAIVAGAHTKAGKPA